MPRLKSAIKSEVDKRLHIHLAKALHELEQARDVCIQFSKNATKQANTLRSMASESPFQRKVVAALPPEANDNVLRGQSRAAETTARTINSMMLAIDRIGHLSPSVDMTDPDLISEAVRSLQREEAKASQAEHKKRIEGREHQESQYELGDDEE